MAITSEIWNFSRGGFLEGYLCPNTPNSMASATRKGRFLGAETGGMWKLDIELAAIPYRISSVDNCVIANNDLWMNETAVQNLQSYELYFWRISVFMALQKLLISRMPPSCSAVWPIEKFLACMVTTQWLGFLIWGSWGLSGWSGVINKTQGWRM